MKKLILLTSLCFLNPAQAELQALNSEELENERAVSNITAFQNSTAPVLVELQNNIPVDNDLRIQQELNALRISSPSEPGLIQSIQLGNQLLQGPNSGIEVINNNLLNF